MFIQNLIIHKVLLISNTPPRAENFQPSYSLGYSHQNTNPVMGHSSSRLDTALSLCRGVLQMVYTCGWEGNRGESVEEHL